MGKYYYCDLCGKIVNVLYSITLIDGRTVDLCRSCYYNKKIGELKIDYEEAEA